MNFSRYNVFLKIASAPNLKPNFTIGSRFCSEKVIVFSESPQKWKVPQKEPEERDPTQQLLKYTNTPFKRKLKVQNDFSDSVITSRSKYFLPKRSERFRKSLNNTPQPNELYPDEEIDEVENDNQDKKNFNRNVKSNDHVNYKLQDNPKYKIEFRRDNDLNESLVDSQSYQDLKEEFLNFRDNEDKENKLESKDISKDKIDLTADEFNLQEFVKQFNDSIPGPLDECKENLSDLGTDFSPTFNFAAYADQSELIQTYTHLGVKLYEVEKNQDHMRALLTVDLKKELPLYIQFLHDCGVPADSLGDVITENPMVLKEDLEDLKTRINFLKSHNFSKNSIARIITKNPTWLCWATKCIDERLGHFQNEFKLAGSEIRFLATKQPKLITYNIKRIHENTFAAREIMGFNKDEIKVLLLSKPRLWLNSRSKIVNTFDYLHNTMKLSHFMIISQSEIMTCRKSRLKNRHEFLVELKKAEYNPKKPGYIAPKKLVLGSDDEFCRDVAKTAVDTYNLFLKTR